MGYEKVLSCIKIAGNLLYYFRELVRTLPMGRGVGVGILVRDQYGIRAES